MAYCDPQEFFAAARVLDAQTAGELRDAVLVRLEDLRVSRLGPAARGLDNPNVQPTDETRPGGVGTQPLVGPDPAPHLGATLEQLAESNKIREEAQKADLRGPGPAPVTLTVPAVPEEVAKEGQEMVKDTQEAAARATARAMEQVSAPQPVAPVAAGKGSKAGKPATRVRRPTAAGADKGSKAAAGEGSPKGQGAKGAAAEGASAGAGASGAPGVSGT